MFGQAELSPRCGAIAMYGIARWGICCAIAEALAA